MLTDAESSRLRVVLVATRNPLNMGAAARAMSNFGFRDLRVVRPYEAAFRDARSAVGAEDLLQSAREYVTVSEAVADCTLVVGTSAGTLHRDTQHTIHRLEAAAPQIQGALVASKAAILFGSEKFGLSTDDMSHCHWLLHIPTRKDNLSMNLGQAVSVCLYELARASDVALLTPSRPTAPSDSEPATPAQQELLLEVATDILAASGYLDKHPRANMHAELRRIVRRLQIASKDSQAMLGMLRQALWKIRSSHG